MMEQIIVTAVNKYSNRYITFHDLDEITDTLDYDEILDCVLRYYYYFLGVPKENFSLIKDCIEKFYKLYPKTIEEVLAP